MTRGASETGDDRIAEFVRTASNWARWGSDDQRGAANLITAEKTLAAVQLVQEGRTVSLSRVFPTSPAPNNLRPAQHFVCRDDEFATDYYGIEYHGEAATHVDALCHMSDEEGRVWNGRQADDVITSWGATWGGIEQWGSGLLTRGILLDVPRFRGERYVHQDRPVTGGELVAVAEAEGISPSPGDAVVVYCGRDRFEEEHLPWGGELGGDGQPRRPGLGPSCLRFVREVDCAVLAWDMMDVSPHSLPRAYTMHGAIPAFGVALVDNCELGPLAAVCARCGRYEFMFVVAPLVVLGGTGSPVNPIAVL